MTCRLLVFFYRIPAGHAFATLTALFALNYLWATPLFLASLRRRTLRRKPVLFGLRRLHFFIFLACANGD